MTDELRQRITADDEASPKLRQVAEANAQVEQSVIEAAGAASRKRNEVAALEQELANLHRVEMQVEQAQAEGADQSNESAQVAEVRRQRIADLSSEIRRHNQAEEEVARRVRDSVAAQEQQTQSVEDQRNKLRELHAVQVRYEEALDQGQSATRESQQQEERRKQSIDQLSRELAEQEDHQQAINRRMREGVDAHRQLSRANDDLADSSDTSGRSILGLSSNVSSFVKGLAGTAGAIALVSQLRREIQHLHETQKAAADVIVDVSGARRDLALNMFGSSEDDYQSAIQAAQDISSQTGVDEAQATLAIGSAYSASGGDLDRAISRTGIAAKLMAHSPSDIAPIAGSIGDLAAVTGLEDELAAGLLLQTQSIARTPDVDALSDALPKVINAMMQRGYTLEESSAFFGTATNLTVDKDANQSLTASIQFIDQLSEFGKEQGLEERGRALFQRVQSDAGLSEQFVESMSVEAAMKPYFESIMTMPDGDAATRLRQSTNEFPSVDNLGGSIEQHMARVRAEQVELVAEIGRKMEATRKLIQAGDIQSGIASVVREGSGVLKATGQSDLETKFLALESEILTNFGRDDPLSHFIDKIEKRAEDLHSGKHSLGRIAPATEVPRIDLQRADQLRDLAASLRQANEDLIAAQEQSYETNVQRDIEELAYFMMMNRMDGSFNREKGEVSFDRPIDGRRVTVGAEDYVRKDFGKLISLLKVRNGGRLHYLNDRTKAAIEELKRRIDNDEPVQPFVPANALPDQTPSKQPSTTNEATPLVVPLLESPERKPAPSPEPVAPPSAPAPAFEQEPQQVTVIHETHHHHHKDNYGLQINSHRNPFIDDLYPDKIEA